MKTLTYLLLLYLGLLAAYSKQDDLVQIFFGNALKNGNILSTNQRDNSEVLAPVFSTVVLYALPHQRFDFVQQMPSSKLYFDQQDLAFLSRK